MPHMIKHDADKVHEGLYYNEEPSLRTNALWCILACSACALMSDHASAPVGLLIVLINIRSHRDLCAICSSCMWFSHSDHYNIIIFAWGRRTCVVVQHSSCGDTINAFYETFCTRQTDRADYGGYAACHAPTSYKHVWPCQWLVVSI